MKQVLSQLHNIINELQNNNLVKEAKVLDQVFTKLADRGKRWNEVIENTDRPALTDENGQPDLSITDFSLGRREDAIIQGSTAYQKLRDTWLAARNAYVASKKLSFMGNRANQNKLISTYPNELRENKLRAKWLAAEEDLEIWYIGAFIQVKDNKPVPQIEKLPIVDITDEKRNRKRPVVNPIRETSLETKTVSKPQSKPDSSKPVQQNAPSKPEAKPMAKPSAPKPQSVKQQKLQEQVKPIQNNLTESQIYFKAQMSYLEYEDKVKELGSKEKAYKDMQDKVYYADKTKGKLIYKEWQKLTGLNAEMSQDKKPEYTYDPIIDSKYSPAGPEFEAFEASNYFDEYKSKIDAFGSKAKAYADMQAKVYNADKTKGKKIYLEWQKLVDSKSV
jgi:hypothetical protein